MNYEIVTKDEKRAAGLWVRTNNSAPDMGMKIGGLWKEFFEKGIFFQQPGKVNEKSIGLYTNYEGDEKGDYDVYVCCEIEKDAKLLEGTKEIIIPAGNYAKFIVTGHMQKAVAEFWEKLWKMDLDRSWQADYEEYQPGGDMENAVIHIYISLNA